MSCYFAERTRLEFNVSKPVEDTISFPTTRKSNDLCEPELFPIPKGADSGTPNSI